MIEQQKDCVRDMKWCDFVTSRWILRNGADSPARPSTTYIMTQSKCIFNWNCGRIPIYREKEE